MKSLLFAILLLILNITNLYAGEITIDMRFEPASVVLRHSLLTAIKSFREVKIHPFTDRRAIGETFIGELKVNGEPQKIKAKAPLAAYATDAFKKIYAEWGGIINANGPLALKGEITHFDFEEIDGYQARIGFHFDLLDEAGKTLWDGHSTGIVKATGKTVSAESFSVIFSDILRATYAELLEDNKLVGVWSGRVSNTYVIRGEGQTAKK